MVMNAVPIGYKFSPTEIDLLTVFLRNKIKGKPIPEIYPIVERLMYGKDSTPWHVLKEDDLWDHSESPNKEIIYVFTRLIFKSDKTRNRVIRTAGCGTWGGKAVTQDIKNSRGKVIGHKKSFTFKPSKGHESEMNKRGRWIMHEYSLPAKGDQNSSDFVICRISKELPKGKLFDGEESQSTTVDQFNSTDSTVSSTTRSERSRKRKSSSINYDHDHDHRRQKKTSSIIEEQTDQDQEHLILGMHEYVDVIPYSSHALTYLVNHPFTIHQQLHAPLPWDHAETTDHDIRKFQTRR